ncbi:hypothetical protein BC829DRAFT_439370 [Chytridium lagenaria]|nr:hypothetical protein BC829DRAFT_439370 [Chytridium lagenaria]
MVEKEFRECLGNLEWGVWGKAFMGLEKLAEQGHGLAMVYLDAERSPMKNPSGSRKWRQRAEEAGKRLSVTSFFGSEQSLPTTSDSPSTPRASISFPSFASTSTASPPTLDAQYKTALSHIAWGTYDKGIDILLDISPTHPASKTYLSPTISPLKDPAAMYVMGCRLEPHEDAAGWHRRASEAGNHRSMVRLGRMLKEGVVGKGGVQDLWQAVAWFTKSWDVGGNAEAAYEMAVAYAKGVEVEEEVGKRVSKAGNVKMGRG